jgi:hypothetical protein
MYTAIIQDIGDKTHCVCGSGCGWKGNFSKLEEIGDCILTPGDPSPAGRCPRCDDVAYVAEAPPKSIEALALVHIWPGDLKIELCRKREDAKSIAKSIITSHFAGSTTKQTRLRKHTCIAELEERLPDLDLSADEFGPNRPDDTIIDLGDGVTIEIRAVELPPIRTSAKVNRRHRANRRARLDAEQGRHISS